MRFALAINSDMSEEDVMAVIKHLFPEFIKVTSVALKETKNMFVIEENDLYDPIKVSEAEGWLYYKFILSVFPLKGVETTLQYQRELSFILLKKIMEAGMLAEIICEDDFYN